MPFRVRLKAIFKNNGSSSSSSPTSSDSSNSSGNPSLITTTSNLSYSNQDTTAIRLAKNLTKTVTSSSKNAPPPRRGIGDPKVYQPGESMPKPKYRGVVDKKHTQLLEGFAFGEPGDVAGSKKGNLNRLRLGGRSLSVASTASEISPGASRVGSYGGVSGAAAVNGQEKVPSGISLVLGGPAAAALGTENEMQPAWFKPKRKKSGMVDVESGDVEQVDEDERESGSEDPYSDIPIHSAISPLGLSLTAKDIPTITTTALSNLDHYPPDSASALLLQRDPTSTMREDSTPYTKAQMQAKVEQCEEYEQVIAVAKRHAEQIINEARKQAEANLAGASAKLDASAKME